MLWVEAVKLITQLLAVRLLLTPPQPLLLCVIVCQCSSSTCAICCCWRGSSQLGLLLAKEPVGFTVPHKDLRPWRQVPRCFQEHTVARKLLVKPAGAVKGSRGMEGNMD
jgi:hypothetical protein